MLTPYIIHLAIIILVFTLLALSLHIVVGYTGLMNLGHIAFFGVGAYASVILNMNGVPFVLSFFCAGLLAAASGFGLTFITHRLKGDYFALATLGFSFVVYSLMLNWTPLTRGPLGIPGIPKPLIFGFKMNTQVEYLLFVACVFVIITTLLHLLVRSRYGRLLEAVRDDAIGAEALGKNTFRLKYQSMMIGAFVAGITGSLYAHYIAFIDPSTFFLYDLVIIFTIVIVGGLASLRGTIVAGIILILLPEMLRFIHFPTGLIGGAQRILYALILILILMYRPRGLFGKVDLGQ